MKITKIIALGASLAKAWYSDDETAVHDWYERTIRPLGDSELLLVHFACKIRRCLLPTVTAADFSCAVSLAASSKTSETRCAVAGFLMTIE